MELNQCTKDGQCLKETKTTDAVIIGMPSVLNKPKKSSPRSTLLTVLSIIVIFVAGAAAGILVRPILFPAAGSFEAANPNQPTLDGMPGGTGGHESHQGDGHHNPATTDKTATEGQTATESFEHGHHGESHSTSAGNCGSHAYCVLLTSQSACESTTSPDGGMCTWTSGSTPGEAHGEAQTDGEAQTEIAASGHCGSTGDCMTVTTQVACESTIDAVGNTCVWTPSD